MPVSSTPTLRPAGLSSLALFAIPSFIWGTTWLVIKFQLGLVEPEVSVAWRFALASALLLGWCLLRGIPLRFGWLDHLGLAALGTLLFGLNYVLVYRAEGTLTSGLVAVLFAFMVFWNLLGARIFFGTPAPAAVLAVIPGTAVAMGYASVLVAAWCAARGLPFAFDARAPYLGSLLYLAVFGSVVAFVAYLTLLQRIGAGRAGYSTAVIPVVAMLASTLFEDYHWTSPAAVGMALVLAGTVLVLRARERAGAAGTAAPGPPRPRP